MWCVSSCLLARHAHLWGFASGEKRTMSRMKIGMDLEKSQEEAKKKKRPGGEKKDIPRLS